MLFQDLKVVRLLGENVVTSCRTCNTIKGNKLIGRTGFKLNVKPYIPNNYELKEIEECFLQIFFIKVGMISCIGTQN